MKEAFQRVGLIAKSGDERVIRVLKELAGLLDGLGMEAVLDKRLAEALPNWQSQISDAEVMAENVDLIIVVGGDGTLLNAARLLAPRPVPLAGINLGRLGFLTDMAADRAVEEMTAVLQGRYTRDHRHMLHARIREGDSVVAEDLALNDVVIQKADGGRMIEFETWVDDRFVSLHRADGMIAATATGSTAYALSGGGPILHPDVDALALVPICPHTLSDRPLVIPGKSRVHFILRGERSNQAQINWDGQQTSPVAPGQTVELQRSEQTTTLLHPPSYDYFALLRSKLHWGRSQDGNVPR
ncbi:NAD+ kinase [Natronospira proteinivora]|uniref:NAD kinase n=1 Tax=Natronospira proteinivora TaxID=1807133 RepID=A0ABT1G7S6_9GAMM|nr:NAD(+) kinase [Natronospira proteinivora]MCP1727000.1 NAD+ kinase [Natronospira proteinivora]